MIFLARVVVEDAQHSQLSTDGLARAGGGSQQHILICVIQSMGRPAHPQTSCSDISLNVHIGVEQDTKGLHVHCASPHVITTVPATSDLTHRQQGLKKLSSWGQHDIQFSHVVAC